MGVYAKKVSNAYGDMTEIFNNYFSNYARIKLNLDTKVATFFINDKSCEIKDNTKDNTTEKKQSIWNNVSGNHMLFINTEQDNESIIFLPLQTDFNSITFAPTVAPFLIIGTNLKTKQLQPIIFSRYSSGASSYTYYAQSEGMIFHQPPNNYPQNFLNLFFYPYCGLGTNSPWKSTGSELLMTRMGRKYNNEDYLHENLYTCSNHIQLSQGTSCTDGNDYFVSVGYDMYIKSDGQVTWL